MPFILASTVLCTVGVVFLFMTIRGARENLKISKAQRLIPVKQWYLLKSERRCARVRSQLPTPLPGAGEDEVYFWVTGLVRVRLWFTLIPSLAAVILAAVIWANLEQLSQFLYTYTYTGDGVPHTIIAGQALEGICNLVAWVALIYAIGHGVNAFITWSGEFLGLSTYRFVRIRVYPAFAFWKKSKPNSIELSKITTVASENGAIGRAFKYATVIADTPGTVDDVAFNRIGFIPNGVQRALEVEDMRRLATAEQQGQGGSRQPSLLEGAGSGEAVAELRGIRHAVEALNPGSPRPRARLKPISSPK